VATMIVDVFESHVFESQSKGTLERFGDERRHVYFWRYKKRRGRSPNSHFVKAVLLLFQEPGIVDDTF
jgi:hypothetical protein